MTYHKSTDREYREALQDVDWYENDLYQDIEDLIGTVDLDRDKVAAYVAWKTSKYRKPIHDWVAFRYSWRCYHLGSKNPLILLWFWTLQHLVKIYDSEEPLNKFSIAEKLAAGLALRPKFVRRIHHGYGHWTDVFEHD